MSTATDIERNAKSHGIPVPTPAAVVAFIHDLEHAAQHLGDPRLVRFALWRLRQASYAGKFPG